MGDYESEDRPAISVVVASWSGEDSVSRCLDSLEPQWGSAEVIVALNGPASMAGRLEKRYPTVRFVRGPHDASVFELRTLGAEQAHGQLIALTEDHTTVSPQWVEALCAAHGEGHDIVGGPVDNGRVERAYDWALYFCEYGIYMPPLPRGPTRILSGINVAYDRERLMSCRETWRDALYETNVNNVLRTSGHGLYLVPEAWVKSHLQMTLREAMAHLYAGGRHFGRFRKSQSPAWLRMLWVLVSPAVPMVLLGRIVRRTASRQINRFLELFRGLPYFLLLLGAWSAGEVMGYVAYSSSRGVAEPAREG